MILSENENMRLSPVNNLIMKCNMAMNLRGVRYITLHDAVGCDNDDHLKVLFCSSFSLYWVLCWFFHTLYIMHTVHECICV